jgi:gamma-glutamylcyclotransferase
LREAVDYFAYGSNMDLVQLRERGANPRGRRAARLRGYRLRFNKLSATDAGEGKANIVEQPDESVEGILCEVTTEEVGKLDHREAVPAHYLRVNIAVNLENGTEVEAVTYAANPSKLKDGLKPTKAYLAHLLAGRSFLSEGYVRWLKRPETLD